MNLLIDTNAWIGFFEDAPFLSDKAAEVMEARGSHCYISMASVWEASIKLCIGKLRLPYDLEADLPDLLEDNGFQILPLEYADVTGVRNLKAVHGDPFDRLQVIQAQRQSLRVVSRDTIFDAYGLRRIW